MKDYYWLNEDSIKFLERGYLKEGESPEKRIRDIAEAAEKYLKQGGFADKFESYMKQGFYSLASPVWSNFGRSRGLPISCNGVYIEDKMHSIFRRVISQPYGMVVVSGPTGSGKSTSLYASLKEIKNESTNITTVEDPVEYQLEGINQVQVHDSIGLSFGSSLRSILRQDPDILLIGEIRDEETADIAVKFSLTGHLVFSTVHANDAASTVTRLLDIGIKPFLVGSCLNLVMAQRLVRTICDNCKEEYTPTKEELNRINLEESRLKGKKLFQGKGCSHCRNTGYHGRTGIFELIPMSREIRGLIFDNSNEDIIRQKALEEGMITLRESGIDKVLQGSTTIAEVLRSTVEDF